MTSALYSQNLVASIERSTARQRSATAREQEHYTKATVKGKKERNYF
jgi:hypothetical protein